MSEKRCHIPGIFLLRAVDLLFISAPRQSAALPIFSFLAGMTCGRNIFNLHAPICRKNITQKMRVNLKKILKKLGCFTINSERVLKKKAILIITPIRLPYFFSNILIGCGIKCCGKTINKRTFKPICLYEYTDGSDRFFLVLRIGICPGP